MRRIALFALITATVVLYATSALAIDWCHIGC